MKYVFLLVMAINLSYDGYLDNIKIIISKKEYKLGLNLVNDYITQHGESPELIKLRYRCFYSLRNYNEARNDLNKLFLLGLTSDSLYNSYGDICFKIGNLDSCLYFYNQAFIIDSTLEYLNYNYALYYFQIANNMKALSYINREIRYHDDTGNFLIKISILNDLKRPDDALKVISIVENMNVATQRLSLEKSVAYFNKHAYKKALKYINNAIELDTSEYYLYMRRASIEYKLKIFNSTINDLTKYISYDSTNYLTYKWRMDCYEDIGAKDLACLDLEKINKFFYKNVKTKLKCK